MMYQVQVTDEKGQQLFIGPRMDKQAPLYPIVEAINTAVIKGKERSWRDAQVVPVANLKS